MYFSENSLSDAWEKSILSLLTHGEYVPSQRGQSTFELSNVILKAADPSKSEDLSPLFKGSQNFVEDYCAEIREPYHSGPSIHSRLCEFGENKINQIDNVVELLRNSWYSRRAVIGLWDSHFDALSEHPPCTLNLQFLLRENKLHMTTHLRSNDAWLAALPDMICLSRIQKDVSNKLGVDPGTFTHFACSYHIYQDSYVIAKEVFGV